MRKSKAGIEYKPYKFNRRFDVKAIPPDYDRAMIAARDAAMAFDPSVLMQERDDALADAEMFNALAKEEMFLLSIGKRENDRMALFYEHARDKTYHVIKIIDAEISHRAEFSEEYDLTKMAFGGVKDV